MPQARRSADTVSCQPRPLLSVRVTGKAASHGMQLRAAASRESSTRLSCRQKVKDCVWERDILGPWIVSQLLNSQVGDGLFRCIRQRV